MSRVWVQAEEARRGSVPARCAKTGQRCITRHQIPASVVNPVVEWATWTGPWPWRRPDADHPVVLSLLPEVHGAQRALTRTRDATAAALVASLPLVLLTDGAWRRAAVLALLITAIVKVAVAVVGVLWAIRTVPDRSGEWLLVDNVNDDFVAATEAVTVRPDDEPVPVTAAETDMVTTTGAAAADG